MASRRHAAHALGLLLGSVATGTVMSLLLGGLIADRFRKSRLLVVSNILQGMGVGGILLLGRTDPWASLMTCTLTIGRGEGIYRPVYSALLPLIVGKNYIRAANGLRSSTNRVGAIMGSALGGLLIGAFGVRWGMQIDLGTFVVNGILLLSVNDSPSTSDHAVSACRNSACDRVPLVGCRDDTGPRPGFFCGRTGFADASPAVWPHPRFALWIGGFSGRRGGVGRVLDRNRSSHKKTGTLCPFGLGRPNAPTCRYRRSPLRFMAHPLWLRNGTRSVRFRCRVDDGYSGHDATRHAGARIYAGRPK